MKNMWIIYLISSVIFLTFGILMIVEGKGRLWSDIAIIVCGVYMLYTGIARRHNEKIRREREREDRKNDPANS